MSAWMLGDGMVQRDVLGYSVGVTFIHLMNEAIGLLRQHILILLTDVCSSQWAHSACPQRRYSCNVD